VERQTKGSQIIMETLYQLNATASPVDPRDFQAESIFPSDLNLPDVFDPRKVILPVRDQNIQGSCVAESSACLKEIQEKKNVGFEDFMSPQFVYNNRCNQEGEGMYPRDSMNILYKKGIVSEEDYPYGKIEKPEQISQDVLNKASNYKIQGYAYVNTIQTLKAAIYRNGACAFTVPVYTPNTTMWKPVKQGDLVTGGHCMTAVGWTKDGFIIRNSWGEKWGDKGYTIFPYSDWGHQAEVWAIIDDESSKPDPRYSKWYWKTWRAIANTFKNLGSTSIFIGLLFVATIGIGIMDNPLAFIGTGLTPVVIAIWSWLKKLYMMKDR
jgi:C1A family cysteine protease